MNQVDPKTGTLEIQGTFPNPTHALLPGQFGRVRLRTQEAKNVIVVPQRAVQELQSMQSVFTVGPDNKAQARNIVTGDRVGDGWIVTQGLKARRQSNRRGRAKSQARRTGSTDPLQGRR